MKIIKIKYILITISYFVSFYLIYKTFKLVVPNNEIPLVRQNIEPLRVEIKPIKTLKKLEIYEIINEKEEVQEKKQIENTKKESLDTKQKLAVNLKSVPKNNYDKTSNDYRLQFASIKFKTKINKLIAEIKSKSYLEDKDFIIEEVDLPNLGKFFRIQSSSTYDKINAEKKCKELLIKKQQCLIVKIKKI